MVTDGSLRTSVWAALGAVISLVGVTAACTGKDGGADPNAVAVEPADDGGAETGLPPLNLGTDTGASRCVEAQPTAMASCGTRAVQPDAQPADAAQPDGATDDGGEDPDSVYLDPALGSDSDDDQCKYHVHWGSTPLVAARPVTFTLQASQLADHAPMTGAAPRVEAFLDETHVLALAGQTPTETEPGQYTLGPITFDAPGAWTVRFHFFDECTEDAPNSPVGHVAFLVDVKDP